LSKANYRIVYIGFSFSEAQKNKNKMPRTKQTTSRCKRWQSRGGTRLQLQEARKRRHSAIDDGDDDHDRTSIQIPEAQHTRSDQSEGASTRKFKAFHTDTGKKTPEKEQMPSTSSGALETNDNDDDRYKFSSLPSTVCDLSLGLQSAKSVPCLGASL
jgi:hypothetical protein